MTATTNIQFDNNHTPDTRMCRVMRAAIHNMSYVDIKKAPKTIKGCHYASYRVIFIHSVCLLSRGCHRSIPSIQISALQKLVVQATAIVGKLHFIMQEEKKRANTLYYSIHL